MNPIIKQAAEQLEAALKLVPGISSFVYRDPGATVQPPGLVIGPPSLQFENGFADPTGARFPVYAVVEAGGHALEQLWELVPEVSAAVHEYTDGVVVSAEPFAYPQGTTTDLPSYQIIVESPLEVA